MKTHADLAVSIKLDNDKIQGKKAASLKPTPQKKTGQKAWIPAEMIVGRPLNQSTIMILISVTTKKIMDVTRLKALAAYLINAGVDKVIVLVGGALKRFNFWDSKKYQAKLLSNTPFTPPTPEEMEPEAQEWEDEWKKENEETLEFFEKKLQPGHFKLLPWKAFLQQKNYPAIRSILDTKYQTEDLTSSQSSYALAVNSAASSYLKGLIEKKRIHPNHELQAHANIVEYIVEEGPVHAPNILEPEITTIDYVLYPEPMPEAIKVSADILKEFTPLLVPEFRVTREEPQEVIGYSGTVEKFAVEQAKKTAGLPPSSMPNSPMQSVRTAHIHARPTTDTQAASNAHMANRRASLPPRPKPLMLSNLSNMSPMFNFDDIEVSGLSTEFNANTSKIKTSVFPPSLAALPNVEPNDLSADFHASNTQVGGILPNLSIFSEDYSIDVSSDFPTFSVSPSPSISSLSSAASSATPSPTAAASPSTPASRTRVNSATAVSSTPPLLFGQQAPLHHKKIVLESKLNSKQGNTATSSTSTPNTAASTSNTPLRTPSPSKPIDFKSFQH